MSDEPQMNPAQKQLEAALGQLSIPPAAIDRDSLMYRSGWAAALASKDSLVEASVTKRAVGYWPVATVFSALTAALLLVALVMQSQSPDAAEALVERGGIAEQPTPELTVQVEQNSIGGGSQKVTDVGERTDLVAKVLELRIQGALTSGYPWSGYINQDRNARPGSKETQFVEVSDTGRHESFGHRQLMLEMLPQQPAPESRRRLFMF